jgi:hypothetical protein
MIRPKYGAIESVRDICEPWVEIWSGDEWGESMQDLLGASHTSYGLADDDCAIVAEILLRNLIAGKEWADEYDIDPEVEADARAESTRLRDYWLKGGNLGDFHTTIEDAKSSIDQMPDWMFE